MLLLDRLRSLFPADCILCGFAVREPISLCRDCRAALPVTRHPCRRCGIALPARTANDLCGRCLLKPPPFDACLSVYHYQQPIRGLITSFKFRGNFASGRALAELLACGIVQYYANPADGRPCPALPGLLIPIPLHSSRIRERGFNQALLLAKGIARRTGIALATGLLIRTRATVSQSRLHARQRRQNLAGAFELNRRRTIAIPPRVALIDDVITTTTTVAAAAKVLRAAGAEHIDVWSVARA